MLTGDLLRVRHRGPKVVPVYVDPADAELLELADRLVETFRQAEGNTRGELEADLAATFGDQPGQFVLQGLTKLLDDRCDWATVSGKPPDELREAVFRHAAAWRSAPLDESAFGVPFPRAAVIETAAAELGVPAADIEAGLFADLKNEQRLTKFGDTTAEHLLNRYNLALAQAVLYKATRIEADIRREAPAKLRRLLRLVKFHRLVCEVTRLGPDAVRLSLDGPMSLFTATQKYGLQMALFLPALVQCADWEMRAELRWGADRKEKKFTAGPGDGLVSHLQESGTYVPAELRMFVDRFGEKAAGWAIAEESEIIPLGDHFWVPDFRLTHNGSGRTVLLEVLGFWRRGSAENHLQRLRKYADRPFLLAVSDSLHIDDDDLAGLPAGVHRFRQMPLVDEVVKLAGELVGFK